MALSRCGSLILAVLTLTTALAAQRPIPEDKDQQTTESGLKYSVLHASGQGVGPKMGDQVTVHYTAMRSGTSRAS